jgi:hypothetical protein
MNILQNIFKDYYEIIQYTLHPRDVEMENITKMIHCGDSAFGGAMYPAVLLQEFAAQQAVFPIVTSGSCGGSRAGIR